MWVFLLCSRWSRPKRGERRERRQNSGCQEGNSVGVTGFWVGTGVAVAPSSPTSFGVWNMEPLALTPVSKKLPTCSRAQFVQQERIIPRGTGYVSSGCIRVWKQTAQASFWLPHYVMCASVFSSIEWELKVFLHHRVIVRIKWVNPCNWWLGHMVRTQY